MRWSAEELSRRTPCALPAAGAVREATRHHRSGGNGFVIVTPTGVRVAGTSAAIDDVTGDRPCGADTNHYICGTFRAVADAGSEGESAQRLDEAVAMLDGVSDRELMSVPGFLSRARGLSPAAPTTVW